jgi:MFS family permease
MRVPAALAPFRTPSFRFQWPADLATSWAFEMEMLVLGWYILTETGSVVLLTLFAALFNLGTLVAPMFGVVGDRIGQRNLLFAMRSAYTIFATVLTTLVVTGSLSPLYVFISAGLTGLLRPSDIGVRSALATATIPSPHLVSALSISRMTADSARMFGALTGAGFFVAFGMGTSYLAIIGFYIVSALLTLRTGPEPDRPAKGVVLPSPWRDLKQGMSYILNHRRLRIAMLIAFLINLTAFPFMTGLLPYVAKHVYGVDQTGLGYLVASMAFGALLGSATLSVAGDRLRPERIMVGSIVTWYVMNLIFAHMTDLATGMPCILLAGFAQSLSMVSIAVILMQNAAPQFRGRVMGVRMLAIYGHPMGLLIAGALIERIGFMASATIYGTAGLSLIVLIALRWRADVMERQTA